MAQNAESDKSKNEILQLTVFSRQKFSRLLQLQDGKTRRRITGMTHRETWEKTEKGWKLKGFIEQVPTARWEDESQP